MNQNHLSFLPGDHPWQKTVFCYDTVASTNDLAKEMARNGAAHGTVVIASRQTAGRGRMGRSFHAPKGLGIYLSLILRPDCSPDKLMHLTCATAVAMCDAVENCTGYRPRVKWINDLIAEKKKLGGILTELSVNSKTGLIDWAVIGIGINCCHKEADFPEELQAIATSLLQITGKPIGPEALVPYMLHSLYAMDQKLLTNQKAIMDVYRKDCLTVGRQVVLLRSDEKIPGKALDIDDAGGLIMEFSDGRNETVQSGEVSIRDFCGYV